MIVLVKSFAGKGIQTKPDVEATSCRELVRQLKDTAPGTAFGLAWDASRMLDISFIITVVKFGRSSVTMTYLSVAFMTEEWQL